MSLPLQEVIGMLFVDRYEISNGQGSYEKTTERDFENCVCEIEQRGLSGGTVF